MSERGRPFLPHWTGEAALWASAGILAIAAHAGAGFWFMQETPIVAADSAPPAAIMIELAAMPEAIETDETEISDNEVNADDSAPDDTFKEIDEPEPVPEPEPEPDPIVEELPEPDDAETIEDLPPPVPEDIAVPLPTPRPEKPVSETKPKEIATPVKKPDVERPVPKQKAPQQLAQRKAQVQAPKSDRNASQQTSSGVSAATEARWQSRLMAHLERRKRYPSASRSRREEGTISVRFSIDARGNVLSVSIARSSGHPALDEAALSLVRRSSPVPAPPPGANTKISMPITFSVR